MKNDNVSEYLALRGVLAKEKQQLEERLQKINEALGQPNPFGGASTGSQPRGRGRPPGGSGAMSLRQAVAQVIQNRSLTKTEILAEVQRIGYHFTTDNPINSLGTILYGRNPRFRNDAGRFSLVAGSAPTEGTTGESGAPEAPDVNSPAGAFQRRRRQMSPEAKERIAAAQRDRWAKSKAAETGA